MAINVSCSRPIGMVRCVTVTVDGRFGTEEGNNMWESIRSLQQRCQIYYIDFSHITAVEEPGITWLHRLVGWAREVGRSVRFLNASEPIRNCLARAGISLHGTARTCDETSS